jgi:hypothetical protein
VLYLSVGLRLFAQVEVYFDFHIRVNLQLVYSDMRIAPSYSLLVYAF